MTKIETREIGATGLRVTTLGIGGASLGNNVADAEEDVAIDAVEAGIRSRDSDTSTWPRSTGLAERSAA